MNDEERSFTCCASDRDARRHYVGLTSNVAERLQWHNAGQNTHTARDRARFPFFRAISVAKPTLFTIDGERE